MHLYVWQVADDSEDGWGMIAAALLPMGMAGPLVTRNRHIAEAWRKVAVDHGRMTIPPRAVRLARYDLNDVLEVVP